MDFDKAFDQLIGHEGGYVNNPYDKGGETKYGISQKAYPLLDIKAITLDEAKVIYRRDYWDRCVCDRLPLAIRFDIFDTAVNSGTKTAIKILQKALGVSDDGYIGLVALNTINEIDDTLLCVKYNAERLVFMTNLTDWQYFSKGWARRIATNLKLISN